MVRTLHCSDGDHAQCQKTETFQTFEEQNVAPMFSFVFNCDIFLFLFFFPKLKYVVFHTVVQL